MPLSPKGVSVNDTILKIENITKTYPGVTALNDVSFDIKKAKLGRL